MSNRNTVMLPNFPYLFLQSQNKICIENPDKEALQLTKDDIIRRLEGHPFRELSVHEKLMWQMALNLLGE